MFVEGGEVESLAQAGLALTQRLPPGQCPEGFVADLTTEAFLLDTTVRTSQGRQPG